MSLKKFIDFDDAKQVFYYNMYLNDYKFVIKIQISEIKEKEKDVEKKNIIIDNFDLTKYTFLLNCRK